MSENQSQYDKEVTKHHKGLAILHVKRLLALLRQAKDEMPEGLDRAMEKAIDGVNQLRLCYDEEAATLAYIKEFNYSEYPRRLILPDVDLKESNSDYSSLVNLSLPDDETAEGVQNEGHNDGI